MENHQKEMEQKIPPHPHGLFHRAKVKIQWIKATLPDKK
jgi:hypothetical protein